MRFYALNIHGGFFNDQEISVCLVLSDICRTAGFNSDENGILVYGFNVQMILLVKFVISYKVCAN